jgi:YggT family protein
MVHLTGLTLLTLAKILRLLLNLYSFVVAAAVLVRWVNPDPYNPIVRFLYQATEPVFRKVRPLLPRALYRTGIDWSPILVFALLIAADTLLIGLLFDLAGNFLSK